MSFLAGIGDLLKQYSAGNATPGPAVEQHFDQVAQAVPSSTLAGGLAEAFRSGQTAPFPQMAAQLFANGNSQQQAGVLNSLVAALGPAVISQFAGRAPNSPLASLLQSGSVTPAQAASVSPADVEALTAHAQTQDPSIIDRVSAVYAQHPVLIKSLGACCVDDCHEEDCGFTRRVIFPSTVSCGNINPSKRKEKMLWQISIS
jgi:hypothetical protein